MFCYDYPRPAVTVDIAIFTGEIPDLLLIKRNGFPSLRFDHAEIIRKALEKLK